MNKNKRLSTEGLPCFDPPVFDTPWDEGYQKRLDQALQELDEVITDRTQRREWWVLQFPDGGLCGETITKDDGIPGFSLFLYESQEGAMEGIEGLFESDDKFLPFPTKIVIKPGTINV